jgi:hypothetical protein
MTWAKPLPKIDCDVEAPKQASRIQEHDWCNERSIGPEGLHNGRSDYHEYQDLGEPHDSILTRLRSVVYGDITGDNAAEAFVVVEQTISLAKGPASITTDIRVYRWSDGKVAYLGSIDAGTLVTDVSFRKQRFVVISGPKKDRTVNTYVVTKEGTIEKFGSK